MPTQEDEMSKPLSILVIEDHLMQQYAIQALLEGMGHRVTVASDAREALNRLNQPYDLILIDLALPEGINGLEVAKKIRQKGVSTWMVAITARTAHYSKQECLDAKINDFIAKPMTRKKLEEITHQLNKKMNA